MCVFQIINFDLLLIFQESTRQQLPLHKNKSKHKKFYHFQLNPGFMTHVDSPWRTKSILLPLSISTFGLLIIIAGMVLVIWAPFRKMIYSCSTQTYNQVQVCPTSPFCCAVWPNFTQHALRPCGTTNFDQVCQLNITDGQGYCCSDCSISNPFCILNPTHTSQQTVYLQQNNYGYIPIVVGLIILALGIVGVIRRYKRYQRHHPEQDSKQKNMIDINNNNNTGIPAESVEVQEVLGEEILG